MTTIAISASLVLYRPVLPVIERTLLALQRAGQIAKQQYSLQLDLTLVDNSNDESLHINVAHWIEGFRTSIPDWTLQLLRAPGNVGYGRGNNLVIAKSSSDYHLVINPDLFVEAEAMLEALRFMEDHRDVGLLSPAVFGEDGERHYLCKRNPTLLIMFMRSLSSVGFRLPRNAAMDLFEMRDCDYDRMIQSVEYPTGCLMFFRTTPLKMIGGFDPDFFLHYEDADIGRRMLQIARVVYVPTVRVKHRWARDTHRSLRSMLITVRSGWLYWRKWGGVFSNKAAIDPPAAALCSKDYRRSEPVTGSGRRILITGAKGFIGKTLGADLLSRGYRVLGVVRMHTDVGQPAGMQELEMGNIDESTDWSGVLSGVDCVVHLAARVHFMRETVADPLAEYRRVNVALTLNLARQAAMFGVRRFVFISSIKVNGDRTPIGQPFTAEDVPKPLDPFGLSKYEAEQELMQLARQTGLEIVIIRPVLVYGPGVKANFHQMMRWLSRGTPLPLGALHNRRSLVALDNLVDCIATCLCHPAAANQTFLVSDGEDLTVTSLLTQTAAAFHRPLRLLPVPTFLLRIAGRIVGKEPIVQLLCNTMQVDITKTRRLLAWEPPVSVDAALSETVRQYRDE